MTASDIKLMSFDSISPTGIPELTRGTVRTILLADIMKKTREDDDLRPHYGFDYDKMKPNRFAGEKKVYKQRFVVLDEDVSKVFQSSEDVNVVLRSAIRAMRTAAPKSEGHKRRAS